MKKTNLFKGFAFIPPLGVRGLLVGLLFLVIVSCKKKSSEPEPDLPPETQQGANTFGCYLNGVPWKPSSRSLGNPTLYIQLDGPYFVLYAYYDDNGRDERIDFFSQKINPLKEGNYIMNKKNNLDNTFGIRDYKKNIRFDGTDSDVIDDGLLTITKFDTQKKFVSGKFWFKLQKEMLNTKLLRDVLTFLIKKTKNSLNFKKLCYFHSKNRFCNVFSY